MKICTSCNQEKSFDEFYKDSRKKQGYRNICKTCFGKKYPFKVTEQSRENWRNYRRSERGTVTMLLNNAMDRAKKKAISFELDRDWVTERLSIGKCEVSGIEFDLGVTAGFRARPFSPSIDKIDARGGYTKDNCRMVCFCVNMAMSDWGVDSFYYMCEMALRNKPK